MKGYLYLIKNNINNKVYIGKTYSSVEDRFKRHLIDAKIHITRPICRALNKYGSDNFSVETLGEYEEGDLENQEELTIAKYNSYYTGYNATLGGDGSKKPKNYTEDSLLKTFNDTKCFRKTAEILGHGTKLIRQELYNLGIEKPGTTRPRNRKTVTVTEIDESFNSAADCARFLIHCELTKAKMLIA